MSKRKRTHRGGAFEQNKKGKTNLLDFVFGPRPRQGKGKETAPSSQAFRTNSDHSTVYHQLIKRYPSLMKKVPFMRAKKRSSTFSSTSLTSTHSSSTPIHPVLNSSSSSFSVPCIIAGSYTSFDNKIQKMLVRKLRDRADNRAFWAKSDHFMTTMELYEARRENKRMQLQQQQQQQKQTILVKGESGVSSVGKCAVPLSTSVGKCVRFLRRVEATVDELTLQKFRTILQEYSVDTSREKLLLFEKKIAKLFGRKYPNLLLLTADFTGREYLKLAL
jgi:hypothetical protein